MIDSRMSRRVGLAIFALALVLRLAWVLTLENRLTWIDEQEFAQIAEHMSHGDGYVSSSFRANPILPTYLAVVFRVFGNDYLVARIGQSLIGALTCVLLYRIAAMLVGPAVGILSGLLLAIYPAHIYLAGVLYVDSWLTFFCALSVYLAAHTLRARGRLGLAFLTGVSLGFMALTRAMFMVYVPCVCVAWMYGGRWGWRRTSLACATLVLGCALTILPWTIRNYAVYGRPILITTGFYTMLWRGNNVLATGGPDDRVFMWNTPAWYERLQSLPEDQRRQVQEQYQRVDRLVLDREGRREDLDLIMDDVLRPLAVDAITAHPLRTAELMAKKVRTLFNAFSETATENDYTTWRNRLIAGVSFYPVLALAVVGALLGLPLRRDLALIYLLIGSVVTSYALLTVCTRFRLPLDPYLIVFAALAVVHLARARAGEGWAARLRVWRDDSTRPDSAPPSSGWRQETPPIGSFAAQDLRKADQPVGRWDLESTAPRRGVGEH
jgi:4-amino-4-deoxy-L-arabinose transferase-like glycosyltransferase